MHQKQSRNATWMNLFQIHLMGFILLTQESNAHPEPHGPMDLISPQPDCSRSCNTMDTGPVHHVLFTPQCKRHWRDGTISWHCDPVAMGEIQMRDLVMANPSLSHTATSAPVGLTVDIN